MKKILITVFQLSVTIAVLYWVYHDPNRRAQMVEAIRNAHFRWVAMGILAYAVVEIAALFRWHVLLRVQKISLSLPRLAGLFFIGMFYNQFLPGGTGGDIIKSYYLLKETPDKKAGALLAVVFDRFIGLVALVAITATLIGLRYDFLSQKPETRNLLWLLLVILGSSVLFLVSTFVISGFKLLHSLPARFPGRDKLIEISAAYHLYARHWRATLVAFAASVVAHLATFTTFLFAASALGAPVPVVANQFRRNWTQRKSFADHAQWSLRCPGGKSHSDRLAEFSHYSRLLPPGSDRLFVLQAEWRSRTRAAARDGRGSSYP
jgi:uncharacterized membrane protein YbhN (UPF0104 family)